METKHAGQIQQWISYSPSRKPAFGSFSSPADWKKLLHHSMEFPSKEWKPVKSKCPKFLCLLRWLDTTAVEKVYVQFNYKITAVPEMFSPRDIYSRFVGGILSENCRGLKTFAWKVLTAFGIIYTYKQTLRVMNFRKSKLWSCCSDEHFCTMLRISRKFQSRHWQVRQGDQTQGIPLKDATNL
jgi:hypothetical protein